MVNLYLSVRLFVLNKGITYNKNNSVFYFFQLENVKRNKPRRRFIFSLLIPIDKTEFVLISALSTCSASSLQRTFCFSIGMIIKE